MGFGGGERLAGLLSDPAARGILGASAGLLAAGAPRTDRPVSLGEAISTGLLSGTQAFDEALAAKQRRDAAKALQDFRLERFDYLKSRDILADQLKADETEYLRSRDAISDTRYDDETSYNRTRNEIADKREADAAALLTRLREARIDQLTKPDKISPLTQIAKINQDYQNGLITIDTRNSLIAAALKEDEVLPLSKEGKLARDRRLGLLGPEIQQPVADITVPELDAPNLRAASTGDITGMAANASNFVAGLFGGSAFPETQEAKAQLNLLNEAILTPMVRAISDRGAVYTQQRMRELLPQTGLSDAENAARMRQLPTKMRQQIASAEATLADDTQSDKAKAEANKAIRELTPLLTTIERSLSQFDTTRSRDPRSSRRNRGGTVDSSQGPIKFKRVDDGSN